MYFKVLLVVAVGLSISLVTSAQNVLQTKCPEQWTAHLGKCYLPVSYSHSWPWAYNFCTKYSAKLAEPKGYALTEWIGNKIMEVTSATRFWTGYNRRGISSAEAYVGRWSDGTETSVEVGVWGHNEPAITNGDCASVSTVDGFKWSMEPCDNIRPFACEMDPCPSDDRDTFMCNGKCIASSFVCDGNDDCGNNMDELNCAPQCTYTYQGSSGEITLEQVLGSYLPDKSCIWTISSTVGTRISIEFEYFETEQYTDIVEILDGGPTPADSNITVRLSGSHPGYTYTSSYNVLILRFVSDSTIQERGFKLSWRTENNCKYSTLLDYSFSNTEIVSQTIMLTSLSTTDKCKRECSSIDTCIGFSYKALDSSRRCDLFNMLPVLKPDAGSMLYIYTCSLDNTLQETPLMASALPQQITTPMYPFYYIGNMEVMYTITAQSNYLITLEVLAHDLCGGDYIDILDQDGQWLTQLVSTSEPRLIISTSNKVHVRMILHEHWKCTGSLIQYTQGCDNSVSGTGRITSPGYGTNSGYSNLQSCTWNIQALSEDRSVNLLIDDFDLHSTDQLVLTYSDGTSETYTNTQLAGLSKTGVSYVNVTLITSSLYSRSGFLITYSPGCSNLVSTDNYEINDGSFNYGDTVTVRCKPGYFFTDEHNGQTEIELVCQYGGNWNIAPLPQCKRAYCEEVQHINNGFIVMTTGVQGADIVTYSCNDGYTMIGSATVTCLKTNEWESTPICSAGSCPMLSSLVTDANIQMENIYDNGVEHGSFVKFVCPQFYELIGSQTVQCIDGLWDFVDGEIPYCQAELCPTPVIDNAELNPVSPPAYIQNQLISVTCKPGYFPIGEATFFCGITTSLPVCSPRICSLPSSLETVNRAGTEFLFGETVKVRCQSNQKLLGKTTSTLNITCLVTGEWDEIPVCEVAGCGEPVRINGSQYIPLRPCQDANCNFEVICRHGYEIAGISTNNNNTVHCGDSETGVWGFGTLHCKGGQCPDPGYPASGTIEGDSFEEDAIVMFRCNRTGYEPIDKYGELLTSIKCVYDENARAMVWDGDVPTCTDTTKPVFSNCPTEKINVVTLEIPNYTVPVATDNNAIALSYVIPNFTKPGQPIHNALSIYYYAFDYEGNYEICKIDIEIPQTIRCYNGETTLVLSADMTVLPNDAKYYRALVDNSVATVIFSPDTVRPGQNFDTLRVPLEVTVTATDVSTQEVLDVCTIQFTFMEGPGCHDWSLDTPNAVKKNCDDSQCTIECTEDSYFIDQPEVSSVTLSCVNQAWNQSTPICASSTTKYVIYKAAYNIEYRYSSAIPVTEDCQVTRQTNVENNLQAFTGTMEQACAPLTSTNSFSIIYHRSSINYELDTNTLSVWVDYRIDLQDETVTNAQTLKTLCSDTVQSKLNTEANIPTIHSLTDPDGASCGVGTRALTSSQPSAGPECEGSYRRYRLINNVRMCLTCPPSYQYDSTTKTCQLCPAGTYSQDTSEGMACLPCPDGLNPGLDGLKAESECSFKYKCPPGQFSEDGLSPCRPCPKGHYSTSFSSETCRPCDSTHITLNEGSTSSGDCKTLEEINELGPALTANTPCQPNPCLNEGTCQYQLRYYHCVCRTGYTGDICERSVNVCDSNPCENNGICSDLGDGTFSCLCNLPSGSNELSGDRCEIDLLGCTPEFCKNNGTCHNGRSSPYCKCPSYSGFNNADGQCQSSNDQCRQNPCLNGAICHPHGTYYRTCTCAPGYTGLDCQTNIDDCRSGPCMNGATCHDLVDGFRCECLEGFHGGHCQFVQSCASRCDGRTNLCHSCDNGNCINIGSTYNCICLQGYTGVNCETEINPCNNFPCQHGGTCTAQMSAMSYSCTCPPSWTGMNCEMEVKTECPNGDSCFNDGTCHSSSSGYVCRCAADYIGKTCSDEYNLCDRANPCIEDRGQCVLTEEGVTSCSCNTGYNGDSCEIESPSCSTNPCQNGGTCNDASGNVVCTCSEGYTGSRCETMEDMCQNNPCGANQACIPSHNSYDCVCTSGKRGRNCDKDVDGAFDYLITPKRIGRQEASLVSFYADSLTSLTVAFRVRYTKLHGQGEGVIMTVIGSSSIDSLIPEEPDYQWTFTSTEVIVEKSSTNKRKRRAVKRLIYASPLNDGYWHHILLTWSASSGEITLYVDNNSPEQEFFSQGESLASRGFLVFGKFDPSLGLTVPYESFEGKITQLHVVREIISSFSMLSNSNEDLLNEAITTMLLYSVTYDTEDSELCTDGSTCVGTSSGMAGPEVTFCPSDHLDVTARLEVPNLPTPTFEGTNLTSPISNIANVGSALDWGLHGIVVAVFDEEGNAAVCSYVLYNREEDCGTGPSSAQCVTSPSGAIRCTDKCSTNQALSGGIPLYQTCSMYGMWDEEVKHATYIYPACSVTSTLTDSVTLDLTLKTSKTCNEDLASAYGSRVLTNLVRLNQELQLCPNGCSQVPRVFTCTGTNTMQATITFGLISAFITYEGLTLNPLERVKVAVGDEQAFTYISPSDNTSTVTPVITSLAVTSAPECQSGYEVSGDKCVRCGSGTEYNPDTKTCVICAVGTYSVAGISCSACHADKTTATQGSQEATHCLDKCVSGRFYNYNKCDSCPVGFYQSETGKFYCEACTVTKTTENAGSNTPGACVDPTTLGTTPSPSGSFAASTEAEGLSTGIIVAIVLGVLVFLLIVFLIVCFCCCQGILPCFKKTPAVAPVVKDGYYANKYGQMDMKFVSYNLRDVRDKKGRPLDRVPIVESPPLDDTASMKTDHSLSLHVPVFMEKLDGHVKKKQMYISNGGQTMNSTITPRSLRPTLEPLTSSPRGSHLHHYEGEGPDQSPHRRNKKRRHRKKHRDSSGEHRDHSSHHRDHSSHHHDHSSHHRRQDMEAEGSPDGRRPKPLSAHPQHIRSLPPTDTVLTSEYIRPSSALNQRRQQVDPAQYQEFLEPARQPQPKRAHHSSREQKSHRHRHHGDEQEYDADQSPAPMQQIVVEDEEDLR